MANAEHLKVVLEGSAAIRKWREMHPREYFDLMGADLIGADLDETNLSLAKLSGADLAGAILAGANLMGADLTEANLSRAELISANLYGTNLTGANLSGADLSFADLSEAELVRANLIGAKLIGADLDETNLTGANLSGADFSWARLTSARLAGANVARAILSLTVIAGCDLSQALGLADVIHEGPSTIGVDTLNLSLRGAGGRLTPELRSFFINAGVPRELLEALPQILSEVKYHSSFVCYGKPDEEFAEKLVNELRAQGVPCWLYKMDKTPGERTWKEIGQKRREADKMIVLCSSKSLKRRGVLKEIEEQVDEDPEKIVPVSLDDIWKEKGSKVQRGDRDLKPYLLERNYADFAKLPFEQALQELLKGLRWKES